MKFRTILLLALCLILIAAPALAAKAPGAEKLGSAKHAAHLCSHIYAYTCYWGGEGPSTCTDEGCQDYGHLHCYGNQVTVWDTPEKGKSRVPYYPNGSIMKIVTSTEFQLIDVVEYKGKYYAAIRVLEDYQPVTTGFVNSDYIGCDCEIYDAFEEVPEYVYDFGPFDLH